ncbi:MAG: 3'-5' exonuclease [Burkholderiaceae bacterium]
MQERHETPDKEAIALLDPFERIMLDRIVLVSGLEQAERAFAELTTAKAWGFDTESKPTFLRNEASEGPHVLQLATAGKAWVFQLHDAGVRTVAGRLLAFGGIVKVGFGLGDDRKRILHKLGVEPADVLDLNTLFRERGYRKEMGVKGAVAVLFGKRYLKSKKVQTSNWASPRLNEAQVLYAANDAWAALKVYEALLASA